MTDPMNRLPARRRDALRALGALTALTLGDTTNGYAANLAVTIA